MSQFWRSWLTIWCGGVALFGLVLMGGAFAATDGPVRLLYALFNPAAEAVFDAPLRFSVALVGAVTFGWSLTFGVAIRAAHLLGAQGRPIWMGLIFSALAWYVIDSALSIATGYALNAVSNTIVIAAFLLPILLSGVLQDGGARARA